MARAKLTVEMELPKSPLDELKAAVLFSGDYWWMFYACLAGFCLANSRTILKDANLKQPGKARINFFHGCVLMVLANFGGSTLAAIMVGKPVPFVTNEALVPVCLVVWTVAWLEDAGFLPKIINRFLGETSMGAVISSITYEIMRCHVAMACSAMAQATLPTLLAVPSASRVAIVGPLVAGTLGGCGGGFMPLNKGLDPLKEGTNWRIGSAVLNSLWLFASMQYPHTKAALGLSAEWARFGAVCIYVVPPLLHMLTGFMPLGKNPLVTGPKAKTS